jgi:hypothetical protein
MVSQPANNPQRRRRRVHKPKVQSTQQQTTNTPQIRNEHVLTALAMAPFRWCQRGYRHFSSADGVGILSTLLCVYCAGLSIEAVMVAIPGGITRGEYTEEMRRERRFVPKPYVNDGARLDRLNPIPTIQRAVLEKYFSWLPLWIRGGAQEPYWTVWQQPGILILAVVAALTIQHYEGKIFRKRSIKQTLKNFNETNKIKQVKADPQAIAVAEYHARQHNAQGTGSVMGTFFAVVLLYGIEIAAFAGSFSGAGSWVINAVYGFLTIAGFEVFDRMGDDPNKEA